jgi:hypothetical protein
MSLKRKFILSCILILLVTGTAKIWSAFGQAKILELSDPVFGVRFGHLFLSVGLLEIAAAMFCFFVVREVTGLVIIIWLGSCFLVYRAALHWVGWGSHCPCLGTLSDALKISPHVADLIMVVLLSYMVSGSFWLLVLSIARNTHARSFLNRFTH